MSAITVSEAVALLGISRRMMYSLAAPIGPVPCREPVPAKPSFPMDGLRPGTSLNQFVSAALAERLVRDGYQLQLETALRACTAP